MVMTNEGQLTLELDVRTAEQQAKIDSYLVSRKNEVERQIASMTNQYRIFVDAGFTVKILISNTILNQ